MLMSRWPATETRMSRAIARTSVEVNRLFDMAVEEYEERMTQSVLGTTTASVMEWVTGQ